MARRTLVLDQPVEATEVTKKKSRKGIYIGIAILALVPVVGSTFASLININGGATIEFGQGYNVVAACDDQMTLTPDASFAGSASSAQWTLSSVVIDGVGSGCTGKTLTVIPRDLNGNLMPGDPTYTVSVDGASTNCTVLDTCTASLSGETLTITPVSALVTDNINMFTIESS
jgi:hypothetical protein